jgi:hypothetical protein
MPGKKDTDSEMSQLFLFLACYILTFVVEPCIANLHLKSMVITLHRIQQKNH